jgi:hypothetical protein
MHLRTLFNRMLLLCHKADLWGSYQKVARPFGLFPANFPDMGTNLLNENIEASAEGANLLR